MRIADIIPENELKEAVLSESRRKLVIYKLTDERLKKKYGMGFDDFEARNTVKKNDFSWDVERDAMEWEHAIEGIIYQQEKIKKLQESDE